MSAAARKPGLRLELPATSANLGPGFDAAGLALSMHLAVEAHAAPSFSIHATGRNADLCGALERNLMLDTYASVLSEARPGVNHRTNHSADRSAHYDAAKAVVPLRITLHNEIPLGMGCGSSAAALLAGVALANHFGELGMDDAAIVAEASRREGHPDNVAACWYGGFTVSAQQGDAVVAATFAGEPDPKAAAWEMMLAVPAASLETKKARALLPETYTREDAVFNVQRASLLVAAFATGRLDLLATAMQDRMHQPYRAEACPLLKALLPLAAEPEIAGVALSGAGPSVLLFLAPGTTVLEAETRLRGVAGPSVEWIALRIAEGATRTVLSA